MTASPPPLAARAKLGLRSRLALAGLLFSGTLVTLALGAYLVCPSGSCGAAPGEAALLGTLAQLRSAEADVFFSAVTWLGSLAVLAPLSLALAWRLAAAGERAAALFVPLSLLGASLITHFAKLAVARPRPDFFPALGSLPVDGSFPSGHAMQATALALAWLLRPRRHPAEAAPPAAAFVLVSALAGLVALVALSRLYLQVHFPTDVLFGMAAATCWVLALRALPGWRGERR